MLFVSQLPLAWQSQGGEPMVIDVHPSKFRKNPTFSRQEAMVNDHENVFPAHTQKDPIRTSPAMGVSHQYSLLVPPENSRLLESLTFMPIQ